MSRMAFIAGLIPRIETAFQQFRSFSHSGSTPMAFLLVHELVRQSKNIREEKHCLALTARSRMLSTPGSMKIFPELKPLARVLVTLLTAAVLGSPHGNCGAAERPDLPIGVFAQ